MAERAGHFSIAAVTEVRISPALACRWHAVVVRIREGTSRSREGRQRTEWSAMAVDEHDRA